MRKIIATVAILLAVNIAPVAYAQEAVTTATGDYVDQQLAKAEKRYASAQKNLTKWQDCASDKDACIAELSEKAQKAVDRANKRLAAIKQ